jgi:hypothetical protein
LSICLLVFVAVLFGGVTAHSRIDQLRRHVISLDDVGSRSSAEFAMAAQPHGGQGAARRISADRVCGYKLILGFGAMPITNNEQAKKTLNDVIKAAGVRPQTIEIRAAEVDNAYACENEEENGSFKRYILYNPEWLNQLISEVGTDWTARAILAHEVGHHKKGHNLRDQQSCAAALEAEADEVAGEALAKLGATLEEAQAPFRKIAEDRGDECYPSRDERVAAVKRGWESVKGPAYPNAVRKFFFYYGYGDENERGNHFWKRVNDTTWTETFSGSGNEDQIQEKGRITIEGDNGILLRHKTKTYLEYFIPDKRSKVMYIRIRGDGGAWSLLGEMKGIE